MPKKLLVLLVLITLCGLSAAQNPTPSGKAAEDAAKLEKDAVEFLRETSDDVSRLRTLENRISFNAELASLMWFHDEKEAKAMYGGVIADFKQLLVQFDSQMNATEIPDDDSPTGGIFGGYGKSKVERKFRIAMAVRQQIALSLADHAPDLAYGFFYDSLNLISNPAFRKETEEADKYFEARLMQQIAGSDAAKAAEYGKESIKHGLDNNHIELLKKIYAKDTDKGIEFGAAILSRLKSDKSSVKDEYFFSSLLSLGSENLNASKKPGGKKAIYDRNDLRDIADQFAQTILDGDAESGIESAGYLDQIEKYAPGRGAQIRSRFKNIDPKTANHVTAIAVNTAANSMAYASNASSGSNSNSAYEQARKEREGKEKIEKQMMDDISNLGAKPLPKEQRDKVVEQARKIISQTPGKDKKIVALSLLAAQVARAGDKELADEIMSDAERLVNPQPKNYQDFLYSWMLARGYAEANPAKAFPLLESTILRANDTIAAAVKVAEFIDTNEEMIDDGEVQVGMFGTSMMRDMTRELGIANSTILALARSDFGRTRNLTNTFDRTEVRVLAKMLVLRAVLDKNSGKRPDIDGVLNDVPMSDDEKPGDN
ncbi:MAG: hypothetical protein ABIO36_06095 [Pyrinomonadaceae bacterium]